MATTNELEVTALDPDVSVAAVRHRVPQAGQTYEMPRDTHVTGDVTVSGDFGVGTTSPLGIVDVKEWFSMRDTGDFGSGMQYLFMDTVAYRASPGNGGVLPDLSNANNFHFFDTGEVRVEFECANLMQFYIESGVGFDAWYGIQESATHHWSIGQRATDSGNLWFSTGFGLAGNNVAKLTKAGALELASTIKIGAYTLPATDGTNGQVPTTNGSGVVAWGTPSGSGDALVANPLSQFAATTSAQLAGVISNETGSGALVFANSPTMISPTISEGPVDVTGNTDASAIIEVTNTATSASGGGGACWLKSNDGSAMSIGDRFGYFVMGGAEDAANTINNSASVDAYASENWDASNNGARLEFKVTANGATTRAAVLTVESDGVTIGAYKFPATDGTNGQALTTNGSGVVTWSSVAGSSPLTTKGDIYTYSTVDARLPVGTNTHVLTADSTQATGVKWAAQAAAPEGYLGQNLQTGTTYELVLTDAGKIVEMNNASANTLTIPANASVAFPVDTRIDINQHGAGLTTVAITTDTLRGNAVSFGQYKALSLWKRTATEWVIYGGTTA